MQYYDSEQIVCVVFREGQGTNWKVTRDVGAQMMNAFVAYDEGNFENCVALMKPLKYDILNIGGSNAQVVQNQYFLLSSQRQRQRYMSVLFEFN